MKLPVVRRGSVVYPVLIILLTLAVLQFNHIRVVGRAFPELTRGPYLAHLHEYARLFPNNRHVQVYFGRQPGEGAAVYYAEMEEYAKRLGNLGGVRSILSPTNLKDVVSDREALEAAPIYDGSADSARKLDERLQSDMVFSQLFLPTGDTADGGAYVYLFYEESAWDNDFYDRLMGMHKGYEERDVVLMDRHILEKLLVRAGLSELTLLGLLALFFIVVLEVYYFRSLRYGVIFSLISFIPSFYVMGLLPLLDISFSIFMIPVPILTLVLSTTYTLHIVHFASMRPHLSLRENLATVFPIVSAATATTLLGFLTMVFSSVREMRSLGLLMSIGVFLSLVVAWIALPPLLSGYLRSLQGRTIRGHGLSLLGKRAVEGRIIPFVLLLAGAVGVFGLVLRHDQYLVLERTMRPGELRSYGEDFKRVMGATHRFDVVVNSKEEYGFVSPQKFEALRGAGKNLGDLPYTVSVVSIVDFVDWINGKLEGSDRPVRPRGEIEIGESLELLFNNDLGIGPSSLITPDYSTVHVSVMIDAGGSGGWKSELVIREVAEELGSIFRERFSASEVMVISDALKELHIRGWVKRGIRSSILLFFPAVFLFLMFLYASPVRAFINLFPSLFAALLFLGVQVYAGFSYSAFISVSFCMLIGICIDDSVVLVTSYVRRRRGSLDGSTAGGISLYLERTVDEVGSVIVRTTVIVTVGVAVLLLSVYRQTVHSGILLMISFVFATLLTLFVVPKLLMLYDRFREKRGAK